MQKSGGGSGNGWYSTFLVIPIATTAQLPGFYFRFVSRESGRSGSGGSKITMIEEKIASSYDGTVNLNANGGVDDSLSHVHTKSYSYS